MLTTIVIDTTQTDTIAELRKNIRNWFWVSRSM